MAEQEKDLHGEAHHFYTQNIGSPISAILIRYAEHYHKQQMEEVNLNFAEWLIGNYDEHDSPFGTRYVSKGGNPTERTIHECWDNYRELTTKST